MLAHSAYLVWEGTPANPDFPKRARGDFAGVPADGPVITRLLQSMKDHDVTLNPTLWIFAEGTPQDDLTAARNAWMNAVTKRAQDMGVVIAAGVDSLMTPGDPLPVLHRELEAEVNGAKLTPLQAITSATRGAAHAIGVEDIRGTARAWQDCRPADRRRGSVSADIRNTRRIRYVIKDGRIVRAHAGGRPMSAHHAPRRVARASRSAWPARRRCCAAAIGCSPSRTASIRRAPSGSSNRRSSSIC